MDSSTASRPLAIGAELRPDGGASPTRAAQPKKAPGYTPELDGLRGVAVLLVLASHSGIARLAGGLFGVDVFFVLSGFLITTLLVREFDQNGSSIRFVNFYMRRALRLGPALLLLLAAYLAVTLLSGTDRSAHAHRALAAFFYVSNWVQAFGLLDMRMLSHTWSLSIEEQFYLLWPCALYLMLKQAPSRDKVAAIVALAIVAVCALRAWMAAAGAPWWRIHLGLDTRADPLLVGCLLGLVVSVPRWHAALARHGRTIGFMAAAAVLSLAAQMAHPATPFTEHVHQYHRWGLVLVEAATACLVLHILFGTAQSPLRAFLAWRPLVRIGKISYGLYLFHVPVFMAMAAWLAPRMDLTQPGPQVLAVALATAASMALAAASYRWIEAPALRLKRWFPAGRSVPDEPAADARRPAGLDAPPLPLPQAGPQLR